MRPSRQLFVSTALLIATVLSAGCSWGDDSGYSWVSQGLRDSCALTVSGEVECWGWCERSRDRCNYSPGGPFSQISVGMFYMCGIRPEGTGFVPEGTLQCWQKEDSLDGDAFLAGEPYLETGLYEGTYVKVDMEGSLPDTACALAVDGTASCWGVNPCASIPTPTGKFLDIDVGEYHACGVRESGELMCWGWHDQARCELRYDDYIECSCYETAYTPPSEAFVAVSAGFNASTCALLADGVPICWGGVRTPSGLDSLVSISTGGEWACGLTDTGCVHCWGDNLWETVEDNPFSGTFLQIDLDESNICGIREDNKLVCWPYPSSLEEG